MRKTAIRSMALTQYMDDEDGLAKVISAAPLDPQDPQGQPLNIKYPKRYAQQSRTEDAVSTVSKVGRRHVVVSDTYVEDEFAGALDGAEQGHFRPVKDGRGADGAERGTVKDSL